MKMFFGALFALTMLVAAKPLYTVLLAPDGIQIGEDVGGRLPIKEWDEYPFGLELADMAAGEIRTATFGPSETFHGGAGCMSDILNPQSGDNKCFKIQHTWYDCTQNNSETCEASVQVQNTCSTTKSIVDQVLVTCWNSTFNKITYSTDRSGKKIIIRQR